jgi:hypothetical protein
MVPSTTPPCSARQCDSTGWLGAIPGLRRTDPEHRYWLGDHLFAVSVTGVVGSSKSAWALRRIEATRPIWEPRGTTVHLALEHMLIARFHPDCQQNLAARRLLASLKYSPYRAWIDPLLCHPHWREVRVIAAERPTCCLVQNLAGTYDTGYVRHGDGARVLADLKTLASERTSTYCTRAQLGGYMALESAWGVHYDAGQTIWARPGETRFSPLYSRQECLEAWAAAWAAYVSRCRSW